MIKINVIPAVGALTAIFVLAGTVHQAKANDGDASQWVAASGAPQQLYFPGDTSDGVGGDEATAENAAISNCRVATQAAQQGKKIVYMRGRIINEVGDPNPYFFSATCDVLAQ